MLIFTTLLSCGDDRSGEYYDLTKENQWIYSAMQEHYLWSDSMPSLERRQFFAEPSKFFSSLLYKGDNVSFFNDSVSDSSYGMIFSLMRDPLAIRPGKVYALILDVVSGSPAWNAGLKRGMWVSEVNGKALSTSSTSILTSGTGFDAVTEYVDYDEENGYFWIEGDTLSVAAAKNLPQKALMLDSVYSVRDKNVGYLVLKSMAGETFVEQTQQVMLDFATADVSDIVIDLRYCQGGTIDNATSLASVLVPTSAYTTPFCTLLGAGGEIDTIYNYSAQMTNLSDKNLYIILGNRTHGVAELFTSSLECTRGASRLITIGASTGRGGMMTMSVQSPYGFTINPVVSIMHNAENERLNVLGITPDCAVNELKNPMSLYELGSEQEYILYNVFYLIVNGMLPE